MESLNFAKKALQHVWAEFIDHFDAAANVDLLFPKELIDFSTMDSIRNAKSKKEANQAFLYHLMNNATVESLWKLCELLRDTVRDHHLHDCLAKSLEDELKQFTVPLSSPVAAQRGGRGEDGPSSSQSTTSERSNNLNVFSDEDAASRLGIVAALDLSKGTSQPIVLTDAYLAKYPPHIKIEAEFCRLQSRLAKIFNKHIDDLKPFLRICQRSRKWPFKELEVKDIDAANNIQTIFNKLRIEECWLNTEILIRLIDVLPDKRSQDKPKRLLEDYHRQLGVFSKCVLLSHIPKNDARLEHFYSRLFPKLRVTYDVNMEDFDVSKMFKEQKFLSKFFEIPEEAFHYLEAKPSSTLVTWALAISMEKAFNLFQRVTHEFWNLKEHLIIKVEIESDGVLQLLNHLKGRNLLYQIKKALQGNQDLLACTEHVSRQFLALVDYSHLQRKGTEIEEKVSFIEKPVVKTELSPYCDLDIKTEPSPDVSPEPSSKRFKTETAYEQLLVKNLLEEELTQPGGAWWQPVDYSPVAQPVTMEEGESAVNQVLSTLWSYLYSSLPPNEDFIIQLEIGGILARNYATMLRASAQLGGRACIHVLIRFMYDFFDEPALEAFCAFLDKYGQPTRPLMLEVAARIREEMGLKPPQPVHVPAPEDPQKGTSKPRADVAHAVPGTFVPATFPPGSSSPEPPAPDTPAPTTLSPGTSVPGPTAPGAPMSSPSSYTSGNGTTSASMSHPTVYYYYPVIDKLKTSFSNLADNVLSIIDSLPRTSLKSFRTHFLSNYLKPSFSPDAPLPVIPETVEDLKLFLTERWDPLQIALLKAVVEYLASRRIQAAAFKTNIKQVVTELEAYENLLKGELSAFLSKCRNDTLRLKTYPGHSPVSVKIDSKAAEISLARILELQGFFIDKLGLPDTLFTGYSEGSVVFFSIPAECVCSLPSCLLPSNLSLLEEWKVLFLSVKGAFTVDIKERRVIDSLDKHSLLSSLAEYKTLTKDLRTKVQQMEKDLYFKEEELWVMEREVKVSKKGKGKAVSTDQEIEEKVSFEEQPVAKTELSPYLDIKFKAELSPDVSLVEPSSKRFKTGPDSLAYEPPLEKKSEEKGQDTLLQAKDTQIAKLLEEIRRLKQENNLLHQTSFIAEEPASSISPAKPFKPEQNKVFRSDLVRPGEHHSVKMPDLLIPTCDATPVTIGRDVYLAGGSTDEIETEKLVQVYNLDSGDCRTLPPSPQYWSAAVAIDGTLVLIGGRNSSTDNTTNMVSTWMAAEERWTQDLPPMKMERYSSGVLLLNNHLFVFGGVGEYEKTRLDSFEVLDLNTKQWSEGRGSLPRPLLSPQLGVFGDYVMLYGGLPSAARVSRACYTVPVQVLVDSVTNPLSPPIHWTPVQDAPYHDSTLLTTSHGAVLLGGDSRDKQVTRAIHRFSSSGSWKVIGELSEPRLGPTVVAVSDRSFLVLGGDSDPSSSSLSTLLKSVELISY